MNVPEQRRYAFGDFRVDAVARRLSRSDGVTLTLAPRIFDALLYLVQRPGESLGKDELLAAIWPGRVVEENNLSQSISTLRKLLGADLNGQPYIITEPGRGYRFVASVQVEAPPPEARDIPASAPSSSAACAPMKTAAVPARQWSPTGPARRAIALLGAAVLALALGVALVWIASQPGRREIAAPGRSVAVLPFRSLLAADGDEILEIGMADTLIAKLSASRGLIVSSLGSVRRFGAADQDPLAAARELGVGAVLEGHLQRRADQLHVSARLLGVADGAALWAGSFEGDSAALFTIQDTITEQVATALARQFDPREQTAMRAGFTRDAEAYRLYLQGRYRIDRATPAEIHVGMGLFRRAIDRDPTFALAYAALAEAYRRLPITSDTDPRETFPLARAAAQKALEIDADLADAHAVLGWVAFWYDWNWAAAEQEFRRALALNPSLSEAHLGYAHLLWNTGRDAEAIEQGRLARELDPLSPLVNTIAAGFLAHAQREQADKLFERARQLDPDFWIAHFAHGNAALGAGNYPEAIAAFSRARETSGGSMQAISMLAFAQARSGDRTSAQALLDAMLEQAGKRYVPATSVATVYVALGDDEQAIVWLQRACAERDVRLTFFRIDHRWDALRADPRVVQIAQQLDLPPPAAASPR